MTTLTPAQIAVYARQAGFTGDMLVTAIAVALAESQGNTTAYNPETAAGTPFGSGSRGLWQVYGYAHPAYNNNGLYDPALNAEAAYSISSGGYNFHPWSTYNNGAYVAEIALARTGVTGGGEGVGQGKPTGTTQQFVSASRVPWINAPRVDNLGGVEPFGGFPKPDTNIQLPRMAQIKALLPGVVTALDGGNVAWGAVVTIKLDVPLNSMATHTAYLHLARSLVRVNQHVNSGDLIAYNGYQDAAGSQKVPFGFALYNGDHYGFGAAWALMTSSNLQGQLNPVPYILQAQRGQLPITVGGGGGGGGGDGGGGGASPLTGAFFGNLITSSASQANELINTVPGFTGICESLDMVEQFVPFTLVDKTSPSASSPPLTNVPWDISSWTWGTGANDYTPQKAITRAIALPSDGIQAALVFTTTNAMAALVRATIIGIGLVLLFSLLTNLVTSFIEVKDVAKIAGSALA